MALVSSGIDLVDNIDGRIDEVRTEICGKNGKSAEWELKIAQAKDDFKVATNQIEELALDADGKLGRAETLVRDFTDVAQMSDANYEAKMKVTRRQVGILEQIYLQNPYKPLLELAEAERTESVNLLNNIKERFGGGETTGRCHGNRKG